MQKDNQIYLRNINEAIDWILDDYIKGISYDEFVDNHEKVDAVIRQIAVIGEAMNRIDSDFLKQNSDLPSKDAVAMRNVLVHDYDMVDTEELWKTITRDLPGLKITVENILRKHK